MQFKRWAARHGGVLADIGDEMEITEDSETDGEDEDDEDEMNGEVIEWLKAWERKEKLGQRVKRLVRK